MAEDQAPEVQAFEEWWQKQLKDEAVRLDNELFLAGTLPGTVQVKEALKRRLDALRMAFAHVPVRFIENMQGRAQLLEQILEVMEKGPVERSMYENGKRQAETREIRGSGTFTHSGEEE